MNLQKIQYDNQQPCHRASREINAKRSRLRSLIPYASPPLQAVAYETLNQLAALLKPEFINVISVDEWQISNVEQRFLVSSWRSEWISWAQNQISTLQNLCNSMV
jgi:hypothetical protein